jgi:predicted metalloprotease
MTATASIASRIAAVVGASVTALLVAAGPATAATPEGASSRELHAHVVALESDVVDDLATQWGAWFDAQDLAFTAPRAVIVDSDESGYSPCAPDVLIDSDFENAFFCEQDNTIVLPVDSMVTLLRTGRFGPIDDPKATNFDVAMIIAHEYGHAVQYQLQVDGVRMSAPLGSRIEDGRPSPLPELFADCAAGVWTADADRRGWIEMGDVASGLRAMWALGDEGPDVALPHGSPEERRDAFSSGIQTGDIEDCYSGYIA